MLKIHNIDISANQPLKVEVKKNKTQKVWARVNEFMDPHHDSENSGCVGAIFSVIIPMISPLMYCANEYDKNRNLSCLAAGKFVQRNLRTGKTTLLANTPANKLKIIEKTRNMHKLSIAFVAILMIVPLSLIIIGLIDASNTFSNPISNGMFDRVEKLIKIGFKPTQKLIDLAVKNKHYTTAILLLDNFSGTSTTNRRDLVDQYNTQLQGFREKRREETVEYFNNLHTKTMSDDERQVIYLLKEGKYEQLRLNLGLKSPEAIEEARRILNPETA